jgi:hypothetical protein
VSKRISEKHKESQGLVTCTIKSKFMEYAKKYIFSESTWDINEIVRDWKEWLYNNEWLNIYLITNDCETFDTHTHAGSVSDLIKRVKQHNGEIPGGPQDTKRAAGYWTLMFYMRIPPIRNFSCRELVKTFNKKRGLASRCKDMIEFAMENMTEFKVSRSFLDKNHKNYCEIVESLLRKKFTQNELDTLTMNDDYIQ